MRAHAAHHLCSARENNVKFGFGRKDITPRVGVELCGYGFFLLRRSVGVRDRLWARAMAVESNGAQAVLVSCDLISVTASITAEVRRIVHETVGLRPEAVMVHCTHTHSGPSLGYAIGCGEIDAPYVELLPRDIAAACCEAVRNLREGTLSHAEVPCEGIGRNREYDPVRPSPAEALKEDWRPARPELTDTRCHVLRVDCGGRLTGFLSYFGCHPVVCYASTRHIHGDFCGVATGMLEREHPGSVGLFLQGAEGDVNSCVVHNVEREALLALDVIASRYARSVREGLKAARPIDVDGIASARRAVTFSRKLRSRAELVRLLEEQQAVLHAPEASCEVHETRLAMMHVVALRRLIAALDAGESLAPSSEVQGIRLGPVSMLGAPFEIFQSVKNDVVRQAASPIPLVMGITNDVLGYAADRAKAAAGGYAAEVVPTILGALPFANIHDELVKALVELDAVLQKGGSL